MTARQNPKIAFEDLFFSSSEVKKSTELNISRWMKSTWEGLGTEDPSGLSLQSFLEHHERLISAALKVVRAGAYQPFPGSMALLTTDKARPYVKRAWIDRWLINHLGRLYGVWVEGRLSPNLKSYRRGFGTHSTVRELALHLQEKKETYLFRSDVLGYSEEVRQSLIKDDFKKYTEAAPNIVALFNVFASPRLHNGQEVYPEGKGYPLGSHLTCVVNNVYLADLDTLLSQREGIVYRRYSDDLLFLHQDRDEARAATELMRAELERRGLQLHPKKTIFMRLTRPSRIPQAREAGDTARIAFAYLGAELSWNARIRLSPSKQRILLEAFRAHLQRAAKRISPTFSLEERVRTYCRLLGEFVKNLDSANCGNLTSLLHELRDEEQLRMVDRWLAEEVLRQAKGGRFRRGDFRHFPPHRLRSWGLPSLLHRMRAYGQ